MRSGSATVRRRLAALTMILNIAAVTLAWEKNDSTSPAGEAPRKTPGRTLFESVPQSESHVDFVQPIDLQHPQKFLYVGGFASPGIAIGDINGDGLPDLVFTGGPVPNRLYLQTRSDGKLQFQDVTDIAGLAGDDAWGAGVTLVDIDNDSDLDLYICNYDRPNQLFINETTDPRTPKLIESAKQYGLDLIDASFVAAFSDYDLDGDLDVLVSAYQYINPTGRPGKLPVTQRGDDYEVLPAFQKYYGIVTGPKGDKVFSNVGRRDYLLQSPIAESQGRETRFRDVTKQAGIGGLGVGNSVLWWDYNHDRLPDLYIANDFKVADQLYRNNGDGTFTDVITETFPHTSWFSMGSEAGDVNNDGLLDLFVTDMAGTTHYRSKVTMGEMGKNRDFLKLARPQQYMRNALLINTGTPRFLEAAYMAGVDSSDWSWAAKLADLDNDGWQDLFISNGAARMFNHSDRQITDEQRIGKTEWDLWEDSPTRREENLAFRNRGDLKFEDVSEVWGLKQSGMSYATAYGDLDLDGDLDLVVANLDEPISIYRNQSTDRHFLRLALVGNKSNRSGLGVVVRAETEQGTQTRQMSPSMGFLSCNEPVLHFGLGAATHVKSIRIEWPSGAQQHLQDVTADQIITVYERDAKPASHVATLDPIAHTDLQARWFRPSKTFPALLHQEREFDDYARQPLLPYAHSQLGPGLAVGDVDDDGDMDFYHGRAAGSLRGIYQSYEEGLRVKSVFKQDSLHEDMGAVFFDADRDGDLDLFVVSGSVECEPGSDVLRDRLYLNDGLGNFSAAPTGSLPDLRDSGSVACAADFDNDGDLDLFVGSRVIPGAYPASPTSRLLQNDSSPGEVSFQEITASAAPRLGAAGLVTSALWSDANDDGWLDLFVTYEWGAVRYFRNEPDLKSADSRQLVDRTDEGQLGHLLGWWNGIAGGDLDRDGDIDYIVTNFGLNTTYHASDTKPELLFYGDFDGSGKQSILEAKFEQDQCYPRRGLSCSSHAMPFVREKLPTFHRFGLATLEQIYTEEKLSQSLRLAANVLESGVLVNLGKNQTGIPQFRFVPLPRLAQIAPAFGVAIADFDADGRLDCFLAQNFFAPQLETGRMDGGLGLVLRGTGTDADSNPIFETLSPTVSGIVIPGDAKACSLVDFSNDGWPDLLVTINNGPIEAFEAQPHPQHSLFHVDLTGGPGNPTGVGSRVSVEFQDGTVQTSEVYAGGGYLSQSTSRLSFGCGDTKPTRVRVRWPGGHDTELLISKGERMVRVTDSLTSKMPPDK